MAYGCVKVKTTNKSYMPKRVKKYAKVRSAAKSGRRDNVKRMRIMRSKNRR